MAAAANANDPNPRLIAGAMSGTSADGVDVAVAMIEGRGLEMTAKLICHHHRPYESALKQAIFTLRESGRVALADLARIGRAISLTYAAAVNEAFEISNLKSEMVEAVAAHGQTLYHAPPDTIQWLDPALIAAETGCAVVSDFRRADCAAGGQGAPLVPFADYILFRDVSKNRLLLNLGGIANLTYIPAGGTINQLIAFDTGPGNCLSDWLCRQYDPQGPGYDREGGLAARGRTVVAFKDYFVSQAYFSALPPKSTDGPAMIGLWESAPLSLHQEFRIRGGNEELALCDRLATACLISAFAIQASLGLLPTRPDEVIVSGGGTANQTLMRYLRFEFRPRVLLANDLGIPSESKEAIAFALLGAATLDGLPSNVPSCTGAKRQVVLGSITPRP